MPKIQKLSISLAAAVAALSMRPGVAQTNPTSWRPIVYDQVYWNVPGSFQGKLGEVSPAYKTLILANGSGQDNKVFHSVRVQGARINGTQYYRSAMTGADFTDVQPNYYRFWGDYKLGTWTLRSEFIFHKSGEFEFKNSFVGTQPSSADIYLRIDHDLVASTNNIVEVASGNGWTGQANAISQTFAAMAKTTGNVVHNNAYFRIVNAADPRNQFYAVFWPSRDAQGDNSPFTLQVKRLSQDNATQPPTNGTLSIQSTHADPIGGYSTYAWGSAEDQVMYLTLKKAANQNYYGIAGKVFQKPAGRSLQVHMHTETGTPTPSATNNIRTSGRSMNQSFNELTDNRWSYHVTTGRTKNLTPTTCGGFTNACLSDAQLHNLMTYWRGQSNAYTPAQRNNYQDWRVDVINVNGRWISAPTGLGGIIFDTPGSDLNSVPREGVAMFWPALTDIGTGYGSDATSTLPYIVLHEVGHTFNARHPWAESPPSVMNAGGYGAGQTARYEAITLNWFKTGPESWVKPGRYGSAWEAGTKESLPPAYRLYGTGTLINP